MTGNKVNKSVVSIIALTLIFFLLRITNAVAIPWLWVFSPIWMLLAEAIIYAIIKLMLGEK